jgi:Spy/CpxP family protein refolding chaperone
MKLSSIISGRLSSLMLGVAVITAASMPLALAHEDSTGTDSGKTGVKKEHKHDGKHYGKHKRCAAMKELGLSDEQKAKLKESHKAFKEQNQAAIDSLKSKYQQLKQLDKNEANAAQRKQLLSEIKQEKAALQEKRKASMQGILTPEQQSKWQSLKQQCKAKHHDRHQNKSKTANPTG